MERLKVFCPNCGVTVVCFPKGRQDTTMNIYNYKGHCDDCERDVFVEDRSSYEQDGNVEIILC